MKNKAIDNLLKPAIETIEKYLSNEKDGQVTVPKEYNGYISSLGASIIQSGIKPAIALYLNTESNATASKIKLIYCIQELIGIQGLPPLNNNDKDIAQPLLFKAMDACDADEYGFRERVFQAATALKLALRTFKLEKSE